MRQHDNPFKFLIRTQYVLQPPFFAFGNLSLEEGSFGANMNKIFVVLGNVFDSLVFVSYTCDISVFFLI